MSSYGHMCVWCIGIIIYIECNIQEEEKEDDDCVEVFSECAPLETR